MSRHSRLWLSLVVVVSVFVIFSRPAVYWWLIGTANSELFYDERPVSYWSSAIREDNAHIDQRAVTGSMPDRSWLRMITDFLGITTAYIPRYPAKILGDDPLAVPVLLQLLKDRDADVRRRALGGLFVKRTRPQALIVPALVEFLQHEDDSRNRLDAIYLLKAMVPEAASAIHFLSELKEHPHFTDPNQNQEEIEAIDKALATIAGFRPK